MSLPPSSLATLVAVPRRERRQLPPAAVVEPEVWQGYRLEEPEKQEGPPLIQAVTRVGAIPTLVGAVGDYLGSLVVSVGPVARVAWVGLPGGVEEHLLEVVCRRFGKDIRRILRLRARHLRLPPMVSVDDLEQEVLLAVWRLLRKKPLGLFGDEARALRLLAVMVRQVMHQHARRLGRAKRDYKRTEGLSRGHTYRLVCRRDAGDGRWLELREQAQGILGRMGWRQRQVVELRLQGFSWADISRQAGGTENGNRMLYSRALCEARGALSPA